MDEEDLAKIASLSEAQKTEFRAAFDIFVDDPVEDAISANNLNRLFAMLGQTPSPEELKEMVEEIDVDGSGSIDFDEFCLMMVKQLEAEQEEKIPERPEKELADAFKIIDSKLDSKIDWDELKAALTATGEQFEDWEVDEIMRDGDKNTDWTLDYDEFINMMKSVPQSV
ncbi:unnamed protein product [Oikopleura dioica]|uniref:Troponin C, slow skeletal and cardiac muscles n=1 Tax=Oikopleura dioica TaxID=34765 RepID=E4XS08_OIKDI|nr:unnamed protein product [Oikopleura dioica]CBY35905.1 unnamed protein product [Oikopleura dioica]